MNGLLSGPAADHRDLADQFGHRPQVAGAAAGDGEEEERRAGNYLALHQIEPLALLLDFPPAPAQGSTVQAQGLHAVEGVQVVGKASVPLPHAVGAHPPDRAAAVGPQVGAAAIFPGLPAAETAARKGEPQSAHLVDNQSLPVSGEKFLRQLRTWGQGGVPVRQGADLLIGAPGQRQGGVHPGGPLQVVQNRGVDDGVLLAPAGGGEEAPLPQGIDGPVAVESGVPCAAVPEEEPAGQGLDAPLLHHAHQLRQTEAAHGSNHCVRDVLRGILLQVPAQLHTGPAFAALLAAHINQGFQPGVEVLLPHPPEIPEAVEIGLVLHGQGLDGQAVQELHRRPVEASPRRGGHAAPAHQPGARRVSLGPPLDTQLAP